MQERRTSSMLQRVPVILAVTAASYGLQLPPSLSGRTTHAQGISGTVAASQPLKLALSAPADGRRQA
jgi:hypothetical protein